ncbi:MAG: glycosyltransferase involved in cell wall biosynthesis [Polyangiales bacterium]|jgi:glycosyltransferase involved in cell wall biosynthesis
MPSRIFQQLESKARIRASARRHEGPIRLTIVQRGDYAEAFERIHRGEGGTYYAQEYTVAHVGKLAARDDVESVSVVNFNSDQQPNTLSNGVESSGVELFPAGQRDRNNALIAAVERTDPTHLVVAAPIVPLLRWGLREQLVMLALFADSFQGDSFRTRVRNQRLAFVLNHPGIDLVANHNLASSFDLARIGVDRAKVVPFDWPAVISPRDWEAKAAPKAGAPLRLVYVGLLAELKGVGDAIEAVAHLRRKGRDVQLTIIGTGEQEIFERLARQHNVADDVHFTGRIPHADVLKTMRSHDVVLVPSRHAYPEGLPMTLYEALCTRTPLVASDHPMFKLKIRDGINAVVHREMDSRHLADSVLRLCDDAELYERLSVAAEHADDEYLCPLKWDKLVSDFLVDEDREKLFAHSLERTSLIPPR